MDVVLSLATGLGLRVYLIRAMSPTSSISPAVLGLWEGILVHQLSFHPPLFVSSSPLDHYLALGLRFMVDFLIAGSWSRVKMIVLWATIGTIISESLFPSFPSTFGVSMRPSSSRRNREKRRQHPRSSFTRVPSHIRVYQEPEELPPPLPVRAPRPQTSTPVQPTIQVDTRVARPDDQTFTSPNFPPPTPPSFFLHAEAEASPFPDSPASPLKPTTTTVFTQVPARPTSALAFYEAEKPTPPTSSAAPLSRPSLLPPTPPDSTLRERTMDSRVDRLSTIDEITSRSEHVSEDIGPNLAEGEDNSMFILQGGEEPLPVPNPTSHYVRAEGGTPIVSTVPSVALTAIPLPIPPFPGPSRPPSDDSDELRTPGQPVHEVGDSDPDELKTPPIRTRASRNSPASSTPGGVNDFDQQVIALSPLVLDSRTIAPDQEPIPVPGTTLSSYAILQPPVAPRPLGSLLDALSGTASYEADDGLEDLRPLSDASDAESVLSTRIPTQLLEHAGDIRKQAVEEGKELERLKGELRKARSEHRPRDVLFLKGDIKNAEERMRKLHERAARRFFAGHNNLQKPNTIDVHGLKPEEALQKTEQALRDLLRSGQSTLRVIVGKGLHSKNRVPVVKNYITEVMQNQHVPCKVDPYNTGILILTLSPPSADHPLADVS